jgi:large subunit ribosomal protein L29
MASAPNQKVAELRELSDEDLAQRVRELKEELFNLRFQNATGQLDNNRRLQVVRRDIARIYTVLRERELGISDEPGATAGDADAAVALEPAADDEAKA